MKRFIYIVIILMFSGCIPSYYSTIPDIPPVIYSYNDIRGDGGYSTNLILHHKLHSQEVTSSASISCDDPKKCEPNNVYLRVNIKSLTWWTEGGALLYFLADGERFRYHDDDPLYSALDVNRTSETALYSIPFSDFMKIANADSVRAEFNGLELDYSWEKRSFYRQLLTAYKERTPEKYYYEIEDPSR